MIVEIPFAGCVAGQSLFLNGITNSRKTFDSRFTVTGSFQNVSVPVRVVGVGMFDFAHGQRGYAHNGVELHPVLDIAFADNGGVTVNSVQLIKDPSFESGTKQSPWSVSGAVLNNSNSEPAHTDRLSQTVTIPASATSAMLSFWLRITTDETTTTRVIDTLAITVRDEAGRELAIGDAEGDPYSNRDAMPYSKRSFDLSRFIGHTIDLVFSAKENRGRQTSFIIDDVLLFAK